MVKRVVSTFILPIVLIAAAVLFVVLGCKNISNRKSWVKTDAVITRIVTIENIDPEESDDHEVYVSYTADGQQYEVQLGQYQASYDVNDTIEIYYDPASPSKIQAGSVTAVILYFVVAVLCLISGPVLFFKSFSRG